MEVSGMIRYKRKANVKNLLITDKTYTVFCLNDYGRRR